jgi:hypothetical protein
MKAQYLMIRKCVFNRHSSNPVQQSHFWDANNLLAGHSPSFMYREASFSVMFTRVLAGVNTLTPCFCNVVLVPTPRFSEWSRPFRFPTNLFHAFCLLSHAFYMPCPSNPRWFYHIIICREENSAFNTLSATLLLRLELQKERFFMVLDLIASDSINPINKAFIINVYIFSFLSISYLIIVYHYWPLL